MKGQKSFFLTLKKISLREIYACVEVIRDFYPAQTFVDANEFEDIFGSLLPETELLFDKICEKDDEDELQADIFEATTIFILFSHEEYEEKLRFIFQIFDFDSSNSLELPELVLTIQSIVRGLCKVENRQFPDTKKLESLSEQLFYDIDRDLNDHIDFNEFFKWLNRSKDAQEFLLNFSYNQSIENAKTKFDELMIHYEAIFNSFGENYVSLDEFIRRLREEFDDIENQFTNYLISVIESNAKHAHYTLNGTKTPSSNEKQENVKLEKDLYLDIIRPWAAFNACDPLNSHYLSIYDLKNLIWVYEGEEPNEFRIRQEMEEIDNDFSETIDRLEWLKNFCVEDASNGSKLFRASLRKMFKKYDIDNSGNLSMKEIRNLLKDSLRGYLVQISKRSLIDNIEVYIQELSTEIISELSTDGDSELSWSEFKYFIDKVMDKQKKLIDLLKTQMT